MVYRQNVSFIFIGGHCFGFQPELHGGNTSVTCSVCLLCLQELFPLQIISIFSSKRTLFLFFTFFTLPIFCTETFRLTMKSWCIADVQRLHFYFFSFVFYNERHTGENNLHSMLRVHIARLRIYGNDRTVVPAH